MEDGNTIVIADWSPGWQMEFHDKAASIRNTLGTLARRIDHIGSTAVPGLAAKPIIDIQVSVDHFEPIEGLTEPLKALGYVWRAANPDLGKRYFRELPGRQRTHIHVRLSSSWHQQWALLFRDYLRCHQKEHEPYAALKRRLAQKHGSDRQAYLEGKADCLWAIIRRADGWAAASGWKPGPSDA